MDTLEFFVHYYYHILFVFASIFVFSFLFLFYHGFFHKVVVKAARPPFTQDVQIVYKFTTDFTIAAKFLAEVREIAPHLDSFSIYHAKFFLHAKSQVGSSVGVVLHESVPDHTYQHLKEAGYKDARLPTIDYAVVASCPYRNEFSLSVAIHKAYPMMKRFIRVNNLCAHPIMELYTLGQVYFIAPLAKQFNFYAEEAKLQYSSQESSEDEGEICEDKKCLHQKSLQQHCCCGSIAHSNSCDKKKREL